MQTKFQVCEIGYYSWNEHFGHHAFSQPAAIKDLSYKDKTTVDVAKYNIHLLTYQPCYQERAYEQDQADIIVFLRQLKEGKILHQKDLRTLNTLIFHSEAT